MKTREDYLKSIFNKRDEYLVQRRKRRRTVLALCIPITACAAVFAASVFTSSRAEVAKSLNDTVGSSLGGDYGSDCQGGDIFAINGCRGNEREDDAIKDGCETRVAGAKGENGACDETAAVTTAFSDECKPETYSEPPGGKSASGEGKEKQTYAASAQTTAVYSQNTGAATTKNVQGGSPPHVVNVSISVSSGTAWTYPSNKDYGDFDRAFADVIKYGLDGSAADESPSGEIFNISMTLSDGTVRVFKWSGNSLCDETEKWIVISAGQKEDIELAVKLSE